MTTAPQILTANRLRDGEIVYWRNGAWADAFAQAQLFEGDETAKTALAGAGAFVRDCVVVNPYLFDVRLESGGIRPVEEREIIRAAGPSVRPDLGKQARHVPL